MTVTAARVSSPPAAESIVIPDRPADVAAAITPPPGFAEKRMPPTPPWATFGEGAVEGEPMSTRRRVAVTAAALLAPVLGMPLAAPAASAPGSLGSQIAVAWQRAAVRTVYTEGATGVPVGTLYLAFTSLAVHDAATKAQRKGAQAAAAAVAQAAHDVLYEYFTAPATRAHLDADLATSLAMVPDGTKEDVGVAIGAAAADAMIASRVGDGRGEAGHVYSKPAAPGVWQPPATGMAFPWLGFVKAVVDIEPVALDGPDALTSADYTKDYNEVLEYGSTDSTKRSPEQTAISQFMGLFNQIVADRNALCDVLEDEPMGLLPTTRMFARMDAAIATTMIRTWRLKFDVGFWRPNQAVFLAETDGNPATTRRDGWVSLIATPAYSDYTTGHGAFTAPFAQVVRRTLGDDTALVLNAGGLQRSYATLTALEYDALNARIWGGLHFRDAMEDGYHLGHETADRVIAAIH